VIGILIGVAAVIITFLLKGVSPVILINLPSIFIVIVGSIGAVVASFGMDNFKRVPKLLGIATKPYQSNAVATRVQLVDFTERARRNGLLDLEKDVEEVPDAFLKHGLQMVIDGMEPETVEEVMNLEIDALKNRHAVGHQMWGLWAGYAPTFGILGAVMGLIAVMAHLSEPEKLGAGIQVAFIATLLAVGLANILFMPMSVALKQKTTLEVAEKEMALAGILALQAGDHPRVVAQKLDTFLTPAQRLTIPEKGSSAAASAQVAAEAA
jgi:chemotaxis protein MotA